MSKGKLIILIIVLVIITIISFQYFSSYKTSPTNTTTDTNFLSEFFPFGKSEDATTPPTDNPLNLSGDISTEADLVSADSLIQISKLPIAGFGVFQKERFIEVPEVIPPSTENATGIENNTPNPTLQSAKPTPPTTEFVPALRYAEKTTGNIYQTFADKIDPRKITNTIIPRIYDAYFGKNGESVVMRYLKADEKTIETFVGLLPKEILGGDTTGDTEIKASFLPENIKDISTSLDNSKIFYLLKTGNGIAGITALANGDKKNQIFSSPFTEWLSWWPNDQMVTLTTKPSAEVPGYMYAIDPNKKDLTKILGDINGLTTLTSPNGKFVLYGNGDLTLGIYNIELGVITQVGTRTLPEKCVWSKSSLTIYCAVPRIIDPGQYPDSWYQGEVSFMDNIWRIDPTNGNATILSELNISGMIQDIDGIKLALDDNEEYLFFLNKKDSSFWELKLK